MLTLIIDLLASDYFSKPHLFLYKLIINKVSSYEIGNFLIKGDNVNFREISCDVEQGGSFPLSLQLGCN